MTAGDLIFSSPDIFTAAESTAAAIKPGLFGGAYAIFLLVRRHQAQPTQQQTDQSQQGRGP
jgi:hypothetical protein